MRPRRILLAIFYLCLVPAMAARAQDAPLTVLVFHRPPYYTIQKDGQIGGFLVEFTRRVLDTAGIPYVLEEAPPQRIIKTLRDDEREICSPGWFKTTQREAFAVFSDPIYVGQPMGAALRASDRTHQGGHPTADSLLASGMRLGLRHGFSYGDWLDAKVAAKGAAVDRSVAENEQVLEMIARGRIDYTFLGPEEYRWLTETIPSRRHDTRFVVLEGMPHETPRYLMCGKNLPQERLDRINAAIRALGQATP